VAERDRRVIIGMGNEFRGDDSAGLVAIDQLRERVPEAVELVKSDGDPVTLMDLWEGASSVVIMDAVVSGQPAGTVHIWHDEPPLATSPVRSSSHQLQLTEILALAEALSRSPQGLVVIGIEAAVVGPGTNMTPEVVAGVARAVDVAVSVCCHPAARRGGAVAHA